MGFDGGYAEAGFTEALGNDAESALVIDHFFLSALLKSKKIVGQINELYKKMTKRDLTTASALGFTGAQIWGHVLNKAGSTDPKVIQKTINEIMIPGKELIMPWGGVKYENFGEDTGQNRLGKAAIVQIINGEREVVFPPEIATAKLVYPFPEWK